MKPTRWLPYLLLIIFWAVSLHNLDRFPVVSQDEPWILSPGYKLFWHGVYGSDLFAGLYGMETHYMEFMPLMSIMLGGVARLIGVGVWPLRYAPVVLGMLTLALTFALGRRLVGSTVGLLAMTLMVFWQWRPTGGPVLGSGLPLLDVARIARYDILVPPLVLSGLWAYLHARHTGQARYACLSGLLAGLAGATHVYGLLWGGILLTIYGYDALIPSPSPTRGAARRFIGFSLSLAVIWLGLAVWPLLYWDDFLHQQNLNGQYFDLFNLAFYRDNFLREPQRYGLGWSEPGLWNRLGVWLLVIGIPLTLIWLGWQAMRQRDWRARLLLVPAVCIPVVSALLIQHKLFNYLISVVPMFALIVSWSGVRWFRTAQRPGRVVCLAALTLMVGQGTWAMIQMQQHAGQFRSPQKFLAELRQAVPPGQRILGTHDYWLALPDRDYRSYAVPIYLSDANHNPVPLTFGKALAQIAPEIVLLDSRMLTVLNTDGSPEKRARSEQFWAYMRQHRAHLIAEVFNHLGDKVQVYQLDE